MRDINVNRPIASKNMLSGDFHIIKWITCKSVWGGRHASSCIYLVRRKHTFAISLEWYTFKLVYTVQNTPKSWFQHNTKNVLRQKIHLSRWFVSSYKNIHLRAIQGATFRCTFFTILIASALHFNRYNPRFCFFH